MLPALRALAADAAWVAAKAARDSARAVRAGTLVQAHASPRRTPHYQTDENRALTKLEDQSGM